MSGTLLTPLVTLCVDGQACDGRGVWKVVRPFRYYSAILNRIIEVEPGFLTDYTSVPRVPLAYWLLGDTSHQAAVVHDWLFHRHEVCDEATANQVLLEAMEAEGVPMWRRTLIYLGVKLAGASA